MIYGGVEIELHIFLASTLVEIMVNFTPWLLYPCGKSPGTYCIGI
jgi:hypothetical protein